LFFAGARLKRHLRVLWPCSPLALYSPDDIFRNGHVTARQAPEPEKAGFFASAVSLKAGNIFRRDDTTPAASGALVPVIAQPSQMRLLQKGHSTRKPAKTTP
jgi:hypothetical protein